MGNLTNADILSQIESAMKTITVTDLGQSVLQPEKFERFVRAMRAKTAVLSEATFIEMQSQIADIDRVGFLGRILVSGTDAAGAHKTLAENEFAKPQFDTNKLTAKELQAVVGLRDAALRRNIERGNFEDTLVDLIGEAAGRDLEEWAILADTDISTDDDLYLSLTDGWAKLAANAVYGVGDGKDFDPAANTYPENLFDAMIGALPKQYLQTRSEWRIYTSFAVEDAYKDLLKARGTALGDLAQTKGDPIPFKGIPVVYCPIIERSATVGNGGAGSIALLGHPKNMAWGVFHEVTIETEREAKDRRTDFVLTVEVDSGYEDENAAVVAYIEQEEAGS